MIKLGKTIVVIISSRDEWDSNQKSLLAEGYQWANGTNYLKYSSINCHFLLNFNRIESNTLYTCADSIIEDCRREGKELEIYNNYESYYNKYNALPNALKIIYEE